MYSLLQKFFPSLTWNIKTGEKILYLTFDDGPTPGVTEFALDVLHKYNAKATFFCLGKNAASSPELYQRIIDEGHATGNHTYHHLNGWKTDKKNYYDDVKKASSVISSKLFRPPYGRISWPQVKLLRQDYNIIMWSVLSYDYDVTKTGEECSQIVIRQTKPGSIIVFHDSIKAEERLKYSLPVVLNHFQNMGYTFQTIQ